MNTVIFKLLPYSESGIVSCQDNSTLTLSGFREDVDLEALQTELEASWLDLAKQEAANRVKNALTAAQESSRPENFFDLAVKLYLGRATPAEREQLDDYYNTLDALEIQAAALQATIDLAESVDALNQISWPEWVEWQPLPLRFKLLAESPKPEPVETGPVNPDPVKPEPARPDLPEPEPAESGPIELSEGEI